MTLKLIVSAAVPVQELYKGSKLTFEFERTKSRLIEAVRFQNPDLQMPPKKKLRDQQVAEAEAVFPEGVDDPRLTDFRWMLEELRVSLFAQELKTPYPVSAKRLQKLWEDVSA